MSTFRKALLFTAIPIVIMSIASAIGVASGGDEGAYIGFGLLWWLAIVFFIGALLAVIVFAIMHRRETVAGILAGLGIAIVSLGATCFAGNALSGGAWF